MRNWLLAALLAFSGPALADGIGNVGGYDANVPVVLGASTAAHSASQALGNWQRINLFRATAQPSGILATVSLGSLSGLTAGATLYILRSAPSNSSTCTDGSPFVLANADAVNLAVAPISLTPATSQGVTQTFAQQGLAWASPINNGDNPQTTLAYVCAVANGSQTPSSTSDLWIVLSLVRD